MARKAFELLSVNNLISVIVIFAGFLGVIVFGRAYIDQRIRTVLNEEPQLVSRAVQASSHAESDKAARAAFAAVMRDHGAHFLAAFQPTVLKAPGGDASGWTPAYMAKTLFVFTDYNCTFCRADVPELQSQIASDRYAYVFHFEAPIIGATSQDMARLSLALAHLGQFKTAYPLLYEHARDGVGDAKAALAAALPVSAADISAAMHSPEVSQRLAAHRRLIEALKISGTPTYVAGGKLFVGSFARHHKAS